MPDDAPARDPIAAVGALAEPTRRALYEHVVASPVAVARDEAAAAVGVAVPLAAFHLDRLVAAGLLDVEYRRRGDRRGPGAGRPAKHYRRSAGPIAVSLPARRYELAATLLAEALSAVDGRGLDALRDAARERGRAMAALGDTAAAPRPAARSGGRPAADPLREILAASGFEPIEDPGSGLIRLRNCPFDALARDFRAVACPMNVALLEGLTEAVGGAVAVPDETPGFCCAALRRTAGG